MATERFTRGAYTLGALLGLGAGVAGAALVAALRRPLPRTSGAVRLPGLGAPVEVIRDCWGVPHLYAASAYDLFYAQGYVHAQDRLWQMEFHRRLGHGQLAEIFGPAALESDRLVRVLGFGRLARREAELLDGEARTAAEAYVRGVNAYLFQNARRLPIEFGLLRLTPRPWEFADALVFAKIMALGLSGNWSQELLRARVVAARGPERAAQLDARYPEDHPLTIPPGVSYPAEIGAQALRRAAEAAPFTGSPAPGQGSNAWVAGGSRTASGRPLLANDPHLTIQMPSLWYENHLCGGGYHVSGASIPGSPGVVIGHNERIAWGVTNAPLDVQDLYIERMDPHDPTRYEFQGAWHQAEVLREEIAVRGQTVPHVEEIRITRHGPIISTLEPEARGRQGAAQNGAAPEALAMRWTALEPCRLLDAVLGLNRADGWDSFRAALADWRVPPQNFVYADVDGHFGYALGGAVPLRARGDGRLPVPGWSGEYEWTGFIPNLELPHALDPEEGLLATANNRIVGDGYPHPLPADWLSGYRAERIMTLLRQTRLHTADSFARIQADQLSLPGRQIAGLAARLPVGGVVAQHARDELAVWDGDLSAASVAGTIYACLRRHLLHEAYAELSDERGYAVGIGAFASFPTDLYIGRALPEVLRRIAAGDETWLPEGRTWDNVLQAAWEAAVEELRRTHGDDVRRWRYGQGHALRLGHPLGLVPALAPLFNRGPFPVGGDADTVFMGYITPEPGGRLRTVMPSYRQICDTDNWDNSRSIHATGQSGHPGSAHYDDLVLPWLDTRAHPMLWSRALIEDSAEATLLLRP